MVGSASSKHPGMKGFQYEDVKSSIPLVVRIPCYNQGELVAAVKYYQGQNCIMRPITTEDLLSYRMQTG
jgi:hypothetical protein